MKKKLLSILLSLALAFALALTLVPTVYANPTPTATLSLGAPELIEHNGESVIAIDVNISENTGSFYTAMYNIVSLDGAKPYISDGDNGYTEGDFESTGISLETTVNNSESQSGGKLLSFDGFRILHDVETSETVGGVGAVSGKLVTVYFALPKKSGTFNFKAEWLDGTDAELEDYTVTTGADVSYYKEQNTDFDFYITFENADGTLLAKDGYYNGETPTFTDKKPAEDGKTFKGWAKKGTMELVTAAMLTSDATLVPIFSDNVIYVSAGGNDSNNGITKETPKLTLQSAIKSAGALYGYTDSTVIVVMTENTQCSELKGGTNGEFDQNGMTLGTNSNIGKIIVTSKWKDNDYRNTANASILMPKGTYDSSTGTGSIIYRNINIMATEGTGAFMNFKGFGVCFGEGVSVIPYTHNVAKQTYNTLQFRVGGENGDVDYDRYGASLYADSGVFSSIHLGSKNKATVNNISFVLGSLASASRINVGNDVVPGSTLGADNGATLTGYSRVEINSPVNSVTMGWVAKNDADYSLIFNNGVTPVIPAYIAPTDTAKKKFILCATEGLSLHNTSDVGVYEVCESKKNAYILASKDGGEYKTVGVSDGKFTLSDSGTYNVCAYKYKVEFKNGESILETKYTNGEGVLFSSATPTFGDKEFKGFAFSTAPNEVIDLSKTQYVSDTVLVPVFEGNNTYNVSLNIITERSFSDTYYSDEMLPYNSEARITVRANGGETALVATTEEKLAKSDYDGKASLLFTTRLTDGEYTLTAVKNGYKTYTCEFTVNGADVVIETAILVAGDIKGTYTDENGNNVIDCDDFVRIVRGFDDDASERLRACVDINEDGTVNVSDLNYVKLNADK